MEETVAAGADGFIAVHPARHNDAQGQFALFHLPDLHIAGMGAQQPVWILLYVEGILHIPRRVVLRQVQGSEVVKVVFNLGAIGNSKTKATEYLDDLVAHEADGMAAAKGNIISRQAYINGISLLSVAALNNGFGSFILCFGELLKIIHHLAKRLLLFHGHIFHLAHHGFQEALRTQEPYPVSFQRSGIA